MGDGTNTINIKDGATASKLKAINLGNGTNTLDIGVSGDTSNGITVTGGSGTDTIKVSGTNGKIKTLVAGANETKINLDNNGSIETINANDASGSTISVSGSGTINEIVGKNKADNITLSQGITVITYTGGTGDDNINLSGATITTLDTNTGNTTISGDTANQGTVSELKTTSGDNHTITVSNATIKKYTAGQKDDTLIVSGGGKIGDDSNKELNFSGGNNTLMVKSGGDISKLSTIKMGDNGNANITIEKGAMLGTTTINLGTAGTGGTNDKNTFTLYASGDNLSLSGSSSTDEITISGNGINLNKLSAGSGDTTINLQSNGGIKTLELGDQANTISINGSGGVSTITASGSVAHTLTVGNQATISSYSGGSGADTITIGSGANINVTSNTPGASLNITTGSGDDTITIEKGAKFGSNVTIDFGASGSGTLKLKGNDFDLTKMDPTQGTTKNALTVKNVTKIDLTEATGNINLGDNQLTGQTTTSSTKKDVEITGVTQGNTLTLSNGAHEKVILDQSAKGISILQVGSGDKIDFHNVANDLSTAISTGSFSSANTTAGSTISASGTYVWHEGMNDFSNAEQVKAKIKDAASNLTSGQKALVAINNGDTSNQKSAIYLVSGSGSGTGNNDITLDLLGIVGNKIDNNDKLASGGVIEFA